MQDGKVVRIDGEPTAIIQWGDTGYWLHGGLVSFAPVIQWSFAAAAQPACRLSGPQKNSNAPLLERLEGAAENIQECWRAGTAHGTTYLSAVSLTAGGQGLEVCGCVVPSSGTWQCLKESVLPDHGHHAPGRGPRQQVILAAGMHSSAARIVNGVDRWMLGRDLSPFTPSLIEGIEKAKQERSDCELPENETFCALAICSGRLETLLHPGSHTPRTENEFRKDLSLFILVLRSFVEGTVGESVEDQRTLDRLTVTLATLEDIQQQWKRNKPNRRDFVAIEEAEFVRHLVNPRSNPKPFEQKVLEAAQLDDELVSWAGSGTTNALINTFIQERKDSRVRLSKVLMGATSLSDAEYVADESARMSDVRWVKEEFQKRRGSFKTERDYLNQVRRHLVKAARAKKTILDGMVLDLEYSHMMTIEEACGIARELVESHMWVSGLDSISPIQRLTGDGVENLFPLRDSNTKVWLLQRATELEPGEWDASTGRCIFPSLVH